MPLKYSDLIEMAEEAEPGDDRRLTCDLVGAALAMVVADGKSSLEVEATIQKLDELRGDPPLITAAELERMGRYEWMDILKD